MDRDGPEQTPRDGRGHRRRDRDGDPRELPRTATGVHGATVIKAKRKGDDWLANRVYPGVPAELFGCEQVIEIWPMSGESNVVFWLRRRGIDPCPDLVKAVLVAAKQSSGLLSEAQILRIVDRDVPRAATR